MVKGGKGEGDLVNERNGIQSYFTVIINFQF